MFTSTWAFRLVFHISVTINECKSFYLNIDQIIVKFDVNIVGHPNNPNEIVAYAGGFETEADATCFGTRLLQRLLLVAAQGRFGIDLGNGRSMGGPSPGLRAQWEQMSGERILCAVHGISVYPEDKPTRFASGTAQGQNILSLTRLTELIETTPYKAKLSNRHRTAAELLGASYFGGSPFATLWLATAAVEAAAEPAPWSEIGISLIENAINSVAVADDTSAEKDELLHQLIRLKQNRKTVRSACLALVGETLGNEKRNEFDEIYKIRSRIIHGNKFVHPTDIRAPSSKAQLLAADLICRLV